MLHPRPEKALTATEVLSPDGVVVDALALCPLLQVRAMISVVTRTYLWA